MTKSLYILVNQLRVRIKFLSSYMTHVIDRHQILPSLGLMTTEAPWWWVSFLGILEGVSTSGFEEDRQVDQWFWCSKCPKNQGSKKFWLTSPCIKNIRRRNPSGQRRTIKVLFFKKRIKKKNHKISKRIYLVKKNQWFLDPKKNVNFRFLILVLDSQNDWK